MFLKKSLIAFCVVLCVILSTVASFACACCSERDTYSILTSKPDDYVVNWLSEMKFHETANLYTGMEDVGDAAKGIEGLVKNYESGAWLFPEGELGFNLTNTFAAKTWKFNFKALDGKTGALTLPMPAQMVHFSADIHDSPDSGLGPLLYKEMRFKGNVASGSGFLRAGIVKPTSYFLVFQGRGRGCTEARDFTHWRLEINGKRAEYVFVGKLSSADPSLIKNEVKQEEN